MSSAMHTCIMIFYQINYFYDDALEKLHFAKHRYIVLKMGFFTLGTTKKQALSFH